MKLSMPLGYSGNFAESARQVVELESAGLDVVWVAEAYGYDGPSQMGYLAAKTERVEIGAAILPIYSRTPTLIAMTAAGIDALSGGRFILGLGASGPQVIEGFHGVPYDRPLTRTREIIEICRDVWAREAPLTHDGRGVPDPAAGGGGHRAGQAAQDHRPPRAGPHPDLGGRAGGEEPGHDRRGGGRLAPVLLRAGEGRRGVRSLPGCRCGQAGSQPWARCRSPPVGFWPSATGPR